jgi:hypothetical protein
MGVPKCRHIKFRHRGITQKKTYNSEYIGVRLIVFNHLYISKNKKNERIKEIMGVEEKPDIIEIVERKML